MEWRFVSGYLGRRQLVRQAPFDPESEEQTSETLAAPLRPEWNHGPGVAHGPVEEVGMQVAMAFALT